MDFDLDEATDVLERTPAVLQALLGGASERWVRGTEGPDTFSPFDVVGHLIDGEETDWIPRAQIILARGSSPRFEPYDRFRHRARNAGRSLESLLAEFARLRAANLDTLRGWRLTPVEFALDWRASRLRRCDAPPVAGRLGGARPRSSRAGRTGDGQAIRRRWARGSRICRCYRSSRAARGRDAMIPGLRYVPGYLGADEHDDVLRTVSGLEWQDAGGRRIQFYGHWYERAKGGVYRAGDLPEWAAALACTPTG